MSHKCAQCGHETISSDDAWKRAVEHDGILVPDALVQRAILGPIDGKWVAIPILMNIPELRLTEAQMMENAMALAAGRRDPWPNRNLFTLRMAYRNSALMLPRQKQEPTP